MKCTKFFSFICPRALSISKCKLACLNTCPERQEGLSSNPPEENYFRMTEWNCAFPRFQCGYCVIPPNLQGVRPVLFWKSHAPCKDDKELFQRKRIQTVCRSGPRSRIWSLQDGRVTTWLATVFWTYKTGFPVRCAKGQTARQTYNSYAICQFCLVCTIVWR